MDNLSNFNEIDNYIQKNLYFSVGENKFALPLKNVIEVMKLPNLDYPQQIPKTIVGVLKFNNIVINIVDVRMFLGLEIKPYTLNNKLIIVKTDESMFGVIVDSINNIIDIENTEIERLPFVPENKIIDAICHIDGEAISIINVYLLEKILKNSNISIEKIDVKKLFPNDKKSIDIFKQRSNYLEEKINYNLTQALSPNDRYISFSLNDTIYCMNLEYVKEVTNRLNITPLPCTPDYIKGLTTLRGDFFTIINLKKFLNLSHTTYSGKNKIIIIDSQEYKMGFLVDEIFEILDISEEQINNRNFNIDDPYIHSEVIANNQIKLILNMNKILLDEKLYIEDL